MIKRNVVCTMGVCCNREGCRTCGFNKDEIERRREIPLTVNSKGLRRKLLSRPKNK